MGLDMYVVKVRKPNLNAAALSGVRTGDLSREGLVLFNLGDEKEKELCKEIMPYAVVGDLTETLFDEKKLKAAFEIPEDSDLFFSRSGANTTVLRYGKTRRHYFYISEKDAEKLYEGSFGNKLDVEEAKKRGCVSYLLFRPADEKDIENALEEKDRNEFRRLDYLRDSPLTLGFKDGKFYLYIGERYDEKEVEIDTSDIYSVGGKYTRDEVRHYAIFDIGSPIRQWRKDYDLSEKLALAYENVGITVLNCGYYPLNDETKRLIKEEEDKCTVISDVSLDAVPYRNECVCYHEWY